MAAKQILAIFEVMEKRNFTMAKKICLIDGSGYIFRAFYGLPPLNSPDGTPVNAVFGFTNMFLKLTQKIPCDYCLVLFDAKRENFRNQIFAEYKGTRKETPEELIPQFPIIREAVDALNICHLEMEGYEADDLIATYAKKAREQNVDVVVVSGDKDLMQLIDDGIEFYDPMKDKFFTPEDVKEKFGVYPDKVVQVQALSGDAIDNVPGVAGIGPKTAALLINEYGSVEELLAHAHEIKQEKRRQSIIDNAENARISLKLVTLKKDVPVEENIDAYVCRCPEHDKVFAFLDKYGFGSIKTRAEKWLEQRCANLNGAEIKTTKEVAIQYQIVSNEADLQKLNKRIQENGIMTLTMAASGMNPAFDTIKGLAIAVDEGEAYMLPIGESVKENLDLFAMSDKQWGVDENIFAKWLKPLFMSKSILKVGHNIKEIMHFISNKFGEVSFAPYDDVEIMSYDLDSSDHSHEIRELVKIYFDKELAALADLLGSGKNKVGFEQLDEKARLDYLCSRADYTLRLYKLLQRRQIDERKTLIYQTYDRPLVETLYNMERRGVKVNAQELKGLSNYFDERIHELESKIFAITNEEFNIGSPKQIGEVLFGKLGLKGKKTATGAWATGAEVLENLADEGVELAGLILDWREMSKLKSTYTDAISELLDKNSRVHTTYNVAGTNTGRLASSNPNLQNIPIRSEEGKKIRSCFIAREGYKIISCDYSQVELRLLAEVADVKRLKQAFAEGLDVHAATASHVFGVPIDKVDSSLRRQAKAINFGIVYGISAFGLAKNIGVEPAQAKAYIDAYFAQMPEIKEYMNKTIEFAHKNGYVQTPFGRRCSTFGINDSNKRVVANAERAAINAPIQGGAADIIKLAMNKMERVLREGGYKTQMLLQVHDELIFEAPEEEVAVVMPLIKDVMENIIESSVKFVAEAGVGDNWTQAH